MACNENNARISVHSSIFHFPFLLVSSKTKRGMSPLSVTHMFDNGFSTNNYCLSKSGKMGWQAGTSAWSTAKDGCTLLQDRVY